MMSNSYTGDHLVEQPAILLMQDALGWHVVNCHGGREGTSNSQHGTSKVKNREPPG